MRGARRSSGGTARLCHGGEICDALRIRLMAHWPGPPEAVSGTGEDLPVVLASGLSFSATIALGQKATYSLGAAPFGWFNQMVNFACTGAPAEATCTVSPNSLTLSGSGAQRVSVSVSTALPSLAIPPLAPLRGNCAVWPLVFVVLVSVRLMLLRKHSRDRTGAGCLKPNSKVTLRL